MPIMAILLLAVLIAMFGFWDTLQAVAGGVLILILLGVLALALLAGLAYRVTTRQKRGGRP